MALSNPVKLGKALDLDTWETMGHASDVDGPISWTALGAPIRNSIVVFHSPLDPMKEWVVTHGPRAGDLWRRGTDLFERGPERWHAVKVLASSKTPPDVWSSRSTPAHRSMLWHHPGLDIYFSWDSERWEPIKIASGVMLGEVYCPDDNTKKAQATVIPEHYGAF